MAGKIQIDVCMHWLAPYRDRDSLVYSPPEVSMDHPEPLEQSPGRPSAQLHLYVISESVCFFPLKTVLWALSFEYVVLKTPMIRRRRNKSGI